MKSLHTKLALSAVAIAMLATPALAARAHTQVAPRPMYDSYQGYQGNQGGQVESYPNGASRTGTAESVESGAEFNLETRGVN